MSREWWQAEPIIQVLPNHPTHIVREDLIDGGSKVRFLPYLVGSAREIVFGGPFCGGAPYALSVWGRRKGVKVTLFYAKRKELHARQKLAFQNGAHLYQVPFGYMSNVQAKARAYAQSRGALFLPLGFDVKDACEPYVEFMRSVRQRVGAVDEVWCATGSGMIARCLGQAFPDAEIRAVGVGLKSRHGKQPFGPNIRLEEAPEDFSKECSFPAPFPCCPNYERKAFRAMSLAQEQWPERTRLFWNVLG